MPGRYGRRGRRQTPAGPPTLLDKVWWWSWAVSLAGAVTFYFLAPLPSDDLKGFSILIFFSPILLVTAAMIIYGLILAIPYIFVIWLPLCTIAWIYASLTPPSETRENVIMFILLSPFILVYSYFGGGFLLIYMYFVLVLLANLFYALLLWRWVFCRPRFRTQDPFSETKLCDHCKTIIIRSGLLLGRWTFLTKASEYYRYVHNPDPRQPNTPESPPACHLCYLLRRQHDKLVRFSTLRSSTEGYGTFPPDANPRDLEGADAIIKISTGTWVPIDRNSWDPDCYLELLPNKEAESRTKLSIEASKLTPLESPRLSSTGSATVTKTAKTWLQTCSAHRACQPQTKSAFIPTRLLNVGQSSDPACRLVERSELDGPVEYFALSHCWGSDVQVTLTVSNYAMMKQEVAISTLSQNFRDAIAATRSLGVQYLWIDCLCIIQDSPEDEDWNQESVLMMDVFANAQCTISATASASSQGGCFRDRMGALNYCKLVTSPTSELRIYVPEERMSIRELFDSRVEVAPLMKRGWVFQERLLSRRIIHFCSDMILFECNTMQATEQDPRGSDYSKVPYLLVGGRIQDSSSPSSTASPAPVRVDIKSPSTVVDRNVREQIAAGNYEDHSATKGIRGALDTLISIDASKDLSLHERLAFNERWYELVASYSQGALTKQTDKLIAIAGVAGLVKKRSHARYLAGLWSNVSVELGLLWRVVSSNSQRHKIYIAPTWSWASVDGQVRFSPKLEINKSEITLHSHVDNAAVSLRASAGSHLDGGEVLITGPTAKCTVAAARTYGSALELRIPSQDPYMTPTHFWPDYEDDWTNTEEEFIALVVMTSKVYSWSHRPTSYGLVLQASGSGEDDATVMKRVGVFEARVLVNFECLDLWIEKWEKRQIKII
ncbi:heterokaryon incompatibility protein-domain-containing protein [Podospora aff. communis PSN243]|uniref:Heterokaryon incompatibility protein-domain-containing protein n=1 Tax=Podospora aff. communis PSN243 TaxID=3040156 RepID=A0AAV9GND9_9PEZI|nr:heterokaryon incompatibility protein-domain-containing protein [Podospora aff. communis PSN243]